jgi:predicted MFS family arabinose efflux permease
MYPVGMKIASGWYDRDLGLALGWLVGALVLGTALPHLIRGLGGDLPWQGVILSVSAVSIAGGLAMFFLVPDGPHLKAGAKFDPAAFTTIFSSADFRASAFGYFGHMWELYTFYVLVPAIVAARFASGVSAAAFWVIASGFVGCVLGGLLVRRFGSGRVAAVQLAASGACALAAPFMFAASLPVFAGWLLLWGATVAGDSPQFSTLTARNAPAELVGSVLTFTNCIGFAITVASIELFVRAAQSVALPNLLPWLALGPALGLWMLRPMLRPMRPGSSS